MKSLFLGGEMIEQTTWLRHWWAILAAGVAVLGQSCFSDIVEGQDSAGRRAFRIVGYLPDYRLSAIDMTAARFVTDLVVFSAEVDASGGLDTRRFSPEHLKKLKQAKKETGVSLILCVGGWERSKGFAAMTASNETRGRFVKEAVRCCLEHRFDGIDLDWEHPAGAAEQQNYSKLLADLNAAFREHGLSLSVTMASWQHLPPAAFQHVDAVQIMSYDHGGRHSTIENSERDIQSLMKMGVPSQKLILGVPFYGRGVKDGGRTLTYAEIVRKHAPGPADDEVDGLYFNGPQTIERKVKLAETAKLGGVMIWELGQDAPGEASLLRVIRRAVPAASSP